MKMLKGTLFSTVASIAICLSAPVLAQVPSATVHGHVNDAVGAPLTSGDVKFTKDKTTAFKDQKFLYTFPLDASGNYTATGIAPGDYVVFVVKQDISVDYQDVSVKAGDDKALDFDMTRAEYLKSMTPEQLKQLEELKKKNAGIMAENQVINNLNATLIAVSDDLKAAALVPHGDVTKDVASMKQAVDAKGEVSILWLKYGDTLYAQADHLAYEDKKTGASPMSDDAVLKGYSDAVEAYKKSVDLDVASKKPSSVAQATAYNQMGNALARLGKIDDASAAFEGAVKADPTKAGMYYNNEAAVLFNTGKNDQALAAAEKAIAADPTRPDPYFVKGQVLIAGATFDAKTSKLVAPPGCVEAYQKYLELAPNGAFAPSVKEVLASLGEKVDTKYKAGKK